MGEPRALSFRFSLCGRVIRCRCLLLANARIVRAGTTDIATGTKGVGLSNAFSSVVRPVENRGFSTNVPGYSMFRAVFCELHESGSSMCYVSASAVRVVGCRPSTMD